MSDTPIADVVSKIVELEDYLKQEQDALDARLKAYKDGRDALYGVVHEYLIGNKLQNIKVDGVAIAHLHTSTSIKVDNPLEFRNFVIEQAEWDMLQVRATKEPVLAWMDAHSGQLPPGLAKSDFTRTQLRRS